MTKNMFKKRPMLNFLIQYAIIYGVFSVALIPFASYILWITRNYNGFVNELLEGVVILLIVQTLQTFGFLVIVQIVSFFEKSVIKNTNLISLAFATQSILLFFTIVLSIQKPLEVILYPVVALCYGLYLKYINGSGKPKGKQH